MDRFDVVVAGAGAAGMIAAAEAGRRGRRVLVVDHNRAAGEKIRISGGGRCNFTNLDIRPEAFLSENPKFALSALKRFTQWDIVARIEAAGIPWHEKTLGQLFCDTSARDVVQMLLRDMAAAGVDLRLGAAISDVERAADGFRMNVGGRPVGAAALIVATGGLSIPKMGASGFGHDLARAFGLRLVPPRAGLVPLTFHAPDLEAMKPLAGVSVDARVATGGASFREGLLITHRGLSGPSVLQASSYWTPGARVAIDLSPEVPVARAIEAARAERGRTRLSAVLAEILPQRLAAARIAGLDGPVAEMSRAAVEAAVSGIHDWQVVPSGTEGYRTAEVTLGGVATDELDARTMAAKKMPGLYFVGEVVDVTGWLGGYNFQWAWSSGWAAGQVA
jgi:predicted Rossmann fold flavoprotein